MFAAFTSQRCRIVLALLIATRISIFAYSSAATNTPMSSSVFKTLLSNSNNNHRGAAEKRRTTAASATQLELLAPANAASAASNASSSAPAAAAAAAPLLRDRLRSRLFRRRASDNGDAGSATTATTTPTSSSALPMLDVLRGGAAEAAVGRNILVAIFCRFANFIGQTKTRCFLLLMLSVFIESYATTLSKQAKDTGNALLFVRACFVYLMWYAALNDILVFIACVRCLRQC